MSTSFTATKTERSPQPLPALCDPSGGLDGSRTSLLKSAIALVEDVRGLRLPRSQGPEGFSSAFQVCLPYQGLFIWHVGDDEVVGNANQVLFVSGGESYRLSQPLGDPYAELIVTPNLDVLTEIAGTSESQLRSLPLFRRRSRRADPDLQSQQARLLHSTANGRADVAAEEMVIDLLRSALGAEPGIPEPSGPTRRLIRRAKEFVESRLSTALRLRDVAGAVGASPAYLTDVFRRVEGVPLHKYITQLRLARALVELPHTDDLTTLAFDLGFSSHSHFSAAFRRAFACTPSQFRASTHAARRPRGS
jgi:AraC family transcriptional regulator